MAANLTGRIVIPGSSNYDQARGSFNLRFNQFPLVIVFAQTANDVRNAILWARQHKVPLRARSGRHSYEGFSGVDGGIIIDVSDMKGIHVDGDRQVAVVGSGWELLPLYDRLWQDGVTVPGGTCPNVGVAGLTLGGGFGLIGRRFGLLSDNLLSLEMVDAQGNIVRAADESHPDLMWASRGGGGGNLGITTALTFRIHPVGDVIFYTMTWSLDDLEQVLGAWQDWAPFADDRLTATLQGQARHVGPLGRALLSMGIFLGPENALWPLLQPLLKAGRPTSVQVQRIPYIEAVHQVAATDAVDPLKFKNTGAFVYQRLPIAAMRTMRSFLENSPDGDDGFWAQALGGAFGRVAPAATAFWHRKAQWVLEYTAHWTDDALAADHIRWADAFRQSMLPYTVGDYVNWPDRSIRDWPGAYYGGNFRRLRMVKREWDPENLFHFAQSIPPSTWPPEFAETPAVVP